MEVWSRKGQINKVEGAGTSESFKRRYTLLAILMNYEILALPHVLVSFMN